MRERGINNVPRRVIVFLALAFGGQLAWHGARTDLVAVAEDLAPPPSAASLRIASMGDPLVLAKTLMLWLQAHDNQPGISIPFRALDYGVVRDWLGRILDLDPRGQYPLLAAKDRSYDRERTKQKFGVSLKNVCHDPDGGIEQLRGDPLSLSADPGPQQLDVNRGRVQSEDGLRTASAAGSGGIE